MKTVWIKWFTFENMLEVILYLLLFFLVGSVFLAFAQKEPAWFLVTAIICFAIGWPLLAGEKLETSQISSVNAVNDWNISFSYKQVDTNSDPGLNAIANYTAYGGFIPLILALAGMAYYGLFRRRGV